MLRLREPVAVTDALDGVEVTIDRVARLRRGSDAPVADDLIDGIERLPLRAPEGCLFGRNGEFWWPLASEDLEWLLFQAVPQDLPAAGPAIGDNPDAPDSGRRNVPGDTPGRVYVLYSSALGQDIFKVGRTSRASEARARELTAATGVAAPFMVLEDWPVLDAVAAERAVHRALAPWRVVAASRRGDGTAVRREFFRLPYGQLRRIITEVLARHDTHCETPSDGEAAGRRKGTGTPVQPFDRVVAHIQAGEWAAHQF